ncbi:AAA family ATPase [Desulfoluna spongiiphila]|uniref:Pilus assembly protein CpaE n=1 Tax=Desulfoluna spongiiphila TaxID=419481 RepID=A0A1G5HDL3_9BACT|nr:hypothetical protein [Desulfoluna spongiiphila]SCY61856.1 pilus assembly protein CpaE [Desulfoluna spongiiphila]VVS94650.1 consensus disorder prediction [Desulfoluna spongiiphila]
MANKLKGLIIGNGNGAEIEDAFAAELNPLIQVEVARGDSALASLIHTVTPDVLFFFVGGTQDMEQRKLAEVIREFPGLVTFLIAGTKDPDLIREGLRIGVTDFLVYPDEREALLPAILSALTPTGKESRAGSVLSFFSARGGQGTSTLALTAADLLARDTDAGVLLLDLDLYCGNTSGFMELKSHFSPFDLLDNIERMDANLLFSSVPRHENGFYVLSTSKEIGDAESLSASDIDSMLNLLTHYFDHVVVDLPHDFSEKTVCALKQTDHLMLVTTQDIPAIKGTGKTLRLLRDLFFGEENLHVMINSHSPRHDISVAHMEEIFDFPIRGTIAQDKKLCHDALVAGKTLHAMQPKAKICRDAEALVHQVLQGEPPSRRPSKSPWSFRFRPTAPLRPARSGAAS